MDSDLPHKAVSIVEIVKGEKKQLKYQFKFDEFEKIFDAVRDVPVAIISIAGACRSGKSFMMTLLADYLLSEGWGNENKDKLTKVFEHRGGVDGHTDGIYVTRKPFMRKTKDEKEIAVFLMDTEGMFDIKTTANDNSTIFALSTLLSSVQIYNINGLIREDDLQHLQLFADNAQCVSNKQRNVSTSLTDNPVDHPFQELLFLCRNWEEPEYADGFEGGSEYFKKVLTVGNKENKLVRQRLTDWFSHVRCSLMPHPGKSIAKRGTTDTKAICFSDMDEDFILVVDALATYLFGEEHLVAKKLNERELTGEGLIDLTREYIGILHSGEMPTIEKLVKSNKKVQFLLRVKDIEFNYEKSMHAQIGEMTIVPEKVKELHLKCLNEAKDLFQMHDILEDEAERQKYQWEMERNIGTLFQVVLKDNEAKIGHIMGEIDDHIMDAGRMYYKSLEEFAAGCWVEDMRKAKDRATEKAHAWFQARMNDRERQWFDENKQKALQSTFDSKQKQFENVNTLRKGELDKDMSQLLLKATREYKKRMKVAVERIEDMENAHENSKSCAIALFNDSNLGKYTNYKERKKLKLELELSEELKKYKKQYEPNQHVTETELESSNVNAENMAMEVVDAVSDHGEGFVWISRNEILRFNEEIRLTRKQQSLEQQYKSAYTDLRETYVDDAILQKKHDKALEEAITGLSDNETKLTEVLKNKQKDLEIHIMDAFQWVKQTNAQNRRLICNKLLAFQSQLEADYSQRLYEVTRKRYANLNNLKKMHESFKAAVEREVEPLIPFPDIYEETIQLSLKNMDAQFVEVKESNSSWNSFKKTTQDVLEALIDISGTVTDWLPYYHALVTLLPTFGVVTAVLNLITPVKEEIDVSKLKSICYLRNLKLVAN